MVEEDGVHDGCLYIFLTNDDDGGIGGGGYLFVKVAVFHHDEVVLS